MRFGIFYEHQLPRPWEDGAEQRLVSDALEQVELADRLGFDTVWAVEHHFLEEYSHSSAPEVFLAAASQRTQRIRLGHGIVQVPPAFNHPARVAERIATLDLVSGGRVEFGTGEASSQMELGGFGVDREQKRAQWEESLDAITRMFVEEPFAGYDGTWTTMPPRNVIPKPVQRPHPPLWVACSRRETILTAARKGLGALSFSFIEPEQAKEWTDAYYALIGSEECVAAGFSVNPNVAVVLPLMCHEDEDTAIDRGIDGAHFFGYSLTHYYVFGQHRPGRTSVWEEFERNRRDMGFAREIVRADDAPLGVSLLEQGLGSLRGAVGTPKQVTDLVERYQDAGVDQVIFVSQAGRNRHEDICESMELFARDVLPGFAERADAVDEAKRARLDGACERALARRSPARSGPEDHLVSAQGEPQPAPPSTRARPLHAPLSFTDRRGWSMARIVDATRFEPARARVVGAARDRAQRAFVAALRGRDDSGMDRIVGRPAVLRAIFRGMASSFRPDRAQGFSGIIRYELTGRRSHRWTVLVTGSHATASPGGDGDPAVTVRMSVPDFARIVTGELQPAVAFMQGKIQVEGDLAVAARLGEMFGREQLT